MRTILYPAAVLLAACAGTEATRYFTLPDSQYIRPAGSRAETAVRVYLAEPLDKGGLVYQTDALHVHFARNHLWAGTLDNALAASFSNKLNRLGSREIFVPAARSQSSRVLKIYVEAFQGSYRGETKVSGYAQLPNGQTRPFDIATPQQGDGYAAMVESLNQGVEKAAAAVVY